jgi:flagellin
VEVVGVDARASALGSAPGQTQVLVKGSEISSTVTGGATTGSSITSFSINTQGADGSANGTVNVVSAANGGTIAMEATSVLKDVNNQRYGAGVAKDLAGRINELRSEGTRGMEGIYASAKTTVSYADFSSASAVSASINAGTLENGDLNINGVDIGAVTFLDKDADGSLQTAINAKTDVTGVKASTDVNGRLVLTAEDGRDVVLNVNSAADLNNLFNGEGTAITGTTSDFTKIGDVTISANRTLSITGAGSTAISKGTSDNTQANGAIANADVTTVDAANETIKAVDSALSQIDAFRADLGAVQNRFESTIRNLSAVTEGLSAANSRIRDADFASETAQLSKNQVLQQAGVSILAQANALPQQALSLLG